MLDWQGWYTLAVLAGVLFLLVRTTIATDVVMLGGALLTALAGVISPKQLFAGFANEGMLTVAALFVIAAALRETGALDIVGRWMIGRAATERAAMLRMAPQVSVLSAFLNNTAVVAMLMPVITDWCRRRQVSPSRLLLPLSHITVLGGCITLVGTSTNIVVNGLLANASATASGDAAATAELHPMRLFELSAVGIPCAIAGSLFLIAFGRRLMPDRRDLVERFDSSMRDFLVNMRVEPTCPLVGKRVEEAGLRRLPGLFLAEIRRGNRIVAPVGPDERIEAADRLTFTGAVSSIVDLERIRGLVAVADDAHAPVAEHDRHYCEAVVSATSPLVGTSVRDASFRARYNAAVLAVHRGGHRLHGRVGDIVLAAGDTLLLQTDPHFFAANRNNPDFYLVSRMEDARPVRHDRAAASGVLLAVFVVLLATEVLTPAIAAMTVAGAMLALRCISPAVARRNVQWDVLIAIGASFALGAALDASGAAKAIASGVIDVSGAYGPWMALAATYLITMLLTELLSNNAAAALVFPIALSIASQLGVSPRPFVMAVTFAASYGFATPMGYQTNMMIFGPGGYRFADFLRVGVPLDLLCMVIAVTLIPFVWPF